MIGTSADIISLVYGLAALVTAGQLVRGWRGLVDGVFTAQDRALAERMGFLFLTPLGVLVHELAHLAVARAMGAQDVSLHFRFYWGFVTYSARLTPEARFAIAAAGPAASAALGLGALLLAGRWRAAGRVVCWTFGSTTLALVLLAYPLASFSGLGGDFLVIYSPATPLLAAGAAVVHVLAIIATFRLMRRAQLRDPDIPPEDGDGAGPAALPPVASGAAVRPETGANASGRRPGPPAPPGPA